MPASAPPTFLEAVGAALRAWREHPWLPVSAIVLVFGPFLLEMIFGRSRGFELLSFSSILLLPGFLGAQRVWYLRAYRGLATSGSMLVRIWAEMWWRFVRLGITVFVPLSALWLAIASATVSRHHVTPGAVVFGLVLFYGLDVLLTFVTPALTLSTTRVFEALRHGWMFTRRTWPRSAPYALIPGIVPLLLQSVRFGGRGIAPVAVTVGIVDVLFVTLMKGATVAFYMSHELGIEDEGAKRGTLLEPRA